MECIVAWAGMYPEDFESKGYASTYFKECKRLQEMMVHPLPAISKFVLYTNPMAKESYTELSRMQTNLLQHQLNSSRKVNSVSASSARHLGSANKRGTRSASHSGRFLFDGRV